MVEEGVDLGLVGRIDAVVDDVVVVELKAVTSLHPIHRAQLLTYLHVGGYPLGMILNFHAIPFSSGVDRRINSSAFGRKILPSAGVVA